MDPVAKNFIRMSVIYFAIAALIGVHFMFSKINLPSVISSPRTFNVVGVDIYDDLRSGISYSAQV